MQPLPNCLCHILKHSWVMCNQCKHLTQSFVGSTPFDPVDPVCRPTPNAAGEPPSSTNKLLSMPSQMKNSLVSVIPTHCWKPFSLRRKCWTCVGWDGVLMSSSASAAFRTQRICNGLIEISFSCELSSCSTFMYVSSAPLGEYAQQWLMHKRETLGTGFGNSILASKSSAISETTKKCFL